ncbi:RNA helicase, partial [Ascosphaera acerosa]
ESDGDALAPCNFKQFLLAAETGSGKSLAYILPVINAIKKEEAAQKQQEELAARRRAEEAAQRAFDLGDDASDASTAATATAASDVARPRAIILVPTAELVLQTGRVLKQLAHTVKFRTVLLASTHTPRRIARSLFQRQGIDVLVATPHLLASIARTHPLLLSRVSHLVVDEADSLLDRSFAPTTNALIDRAAPVLRRLVLASATIPRALDNHLVRRFPRTRRLVTPNLHAVPRRVQLGVVDAQKEPYMGNKKMACADVIWSIGKAGDDHGGDHGAPADGAAASTSTTKHLMVFVNERDTVDEVVSYLTAKGIDAVGLTRDTPESRQSRILEEFTTLPSAGAGAGARSTDRTASPSSRSSSSPPVKVLVTTDLGSRGIDTVAVRTVILYDVPYTTVDFIHRLGRAGRMNRRGRGIVLLGKKDRKDVVREVRDAMFRGQALV